MQIVVIRPPKVVRGILKLMFGIKTIKEEDL